MAQPTEYAPSHEFLTNEGSDPNFPGSELDIEFNALKTTTDEIRTNLALIQRDDGALKNRAVGYDQLADELRTGGMVTFAPWATGIYYVENRIVVHGSSLYRALETHTSGTFATDLANEKWVLLGSLPASTVPGPQGDKGWSPVFSIVTDGTRRVLRVVGWQGGEGTEPASGQYVGASGLVAVVGDAVDIRGPQGAAGDMQGPGTAAVGNVPTFANTDGTELADSGVALSDLATEAYADQAAADAVAALVDSSPAALDTLNELAAALGDDPNFAATVTNTLAGKAAKASNLSDLDSPHTGFDNISVKGSDVASASTIDLDAATGSLIDVTGTTTIAAVTLGSGKRRIVRFTDALTLTHGASLVLPGGASITTAAGDFAVFAGYPSSVVRCVGYFPASGVRSDLVLALAGAQTVAGNKTFTGLNTIQALKEKVTITAGAPAATQNFDVLTQAVQYFTSNNANNWTLNIRGDGSSSLDSIMSTGQSITIQVIVTNGGTAYHHTALTIDGNAVTPQWMGAAAPSAGTVNKRDTYTFQIIKTGSATFIAQATFAAGN